MKAKKFKIKTRPEVTDKLIHDFLIHYALIEHYFIWGTPKLNGGLIYYLSYKNKILMFIIENDEFNARCVNYLEKNGVPVFEDSLECNEYGQLLLNNVQKNFIIFPEIRERYWYYLVFYPLL